MSALWTDEATLFESRRYCLDTSLQYIESLSEFAQAKAEIRIIGKEFEDRPAVSVLVREISRVITLEIAGHQTPLCHVTQSNNLT